MKKKDKSAQKKTKIPEKIKRNGIARQLFLFFIISASMFVLGVFVGRGTAPVKFDIEKLQHELAALKKAAIEKKIKHFKIGSEIEEGKSGLGFYKELKKTENDIDKTKKPSFTAKKYKKENHLKNKEKSLPEKTKPKAVPLKLKATELLKGNIKEKPYTIQVASLKDKIIAEKMVLKLKNMGYPAYGTIADIPGKGVWYRIRIGYYKNKKNAADIMKRLGKDKYKSIVLKR